jgi:hypothetical protein
MTEIFNKYLKWSHLDKTCHRKLNKDAPEYIKEEVRKLDNEYFRKTGRHKILVDYSDDN